MTAVVVDLVRRHGGEPAVAELLTRAGSRRTTRYLEDGEQWVAQDEAAALLAAGTAVTGDPGFARRVGEGAVRRHAGTQVASLLRSLGSPDEVLRGITLTASKFSAITRLEAVEVGAGRAVVRATARPGFARDALLCQWTQGMLSQPTVLFGLAPARVDESACEARGDAACEYTVTWDAELAAAAADPEQRLTAMEVQLAAAAQRLDGVYGMVSELVSAHEIDTLLERIVARAAGAVRAPQYVLAVRTAPDAELHVHAHGLGIEEARAIAQDVESRPDVDDGGRLVAEVASSRRSYGWLVACYVGGVGFFAQEEALLRHYAKYAAAVLDMATAREQAHRRQALSAALLALAQALAQAGTTDEVARRLCDAVPAVVDCDQLSVYLWDPASSRLTLAAAHGISDADAAFLGSMPVGFADTPDLRPLLADQEPIFYDAATQDPLMRRIMDTMSLQAVTVVPIVTRGEVLGVLNVGVLRQAERLRRRPELLDCLTGVAALAAPAMQNGRLVDELHHLATHDALTDLPNRAAFTRRVGDRLVASRRAGARLGLLFVDLNGFKAVNDRLGHAAGDGLLLQVGARIAACLRDGDVVARLGGDEFAVFLEEVSTRTEVQAAARRVRAALARPFALDSGTASISASVGTALWPEDGDCPEDLIRRADARMYTQKRRHRTARARSAG